MSSFSLDWLRLREPYDVRARNPAVLDAVASAVAGHPSIALVDLGCGAGATLRAIASRLPPRQDWRLVDNDLSLLARAAPSVPVAGQNAIAIPIDIACDLEAALDGPLDLVVTSAFLDLVSSAWLDRFTTESAVRALPVYAALTHDGRVEFEPPDPLDARMAAVVNQHQRRDKGFGPALGPSAAIAAITRFRALHYSVVQGTSDWLFGLHDETIQSEFISSWATTARESDQLSVAEIIAWSERRHDHLRRGCSSMRVGHTDFFARPTGTRWADRSQSNSTSPSSQ
ncbi:MAG: class I SAM-dependent methyltransferase [Bradyrhizobiaceae bacterium]|nr:class I SAM-dependent methyltransferase [Bradyrhizobiaceae bacterium]